MAEYYYNRQETANSLKLISLITRANILVHQIIWCKKTLRSERKLNHEFRTFPYYFRCEFGPHHLLTRGTSFRQYICSVIISIVAFPRRSDFPVALAHRTTYRSRIERKRKYVLKNSMFKRQINIDRRGLRTLYGRVYSNVPGPLCSHSTLRTGTYIVTLSL